MPGSRWNCSEPGGTYSNANDTWIELYNPQNQPFNLYASHATIDTGYGTTPFYLPLGSCIAPHGYLVLFPSTFSGLHINANVRFLIEGTTVDQVNIPPLLVDHSFARVPDGSNSWQITNTPTIDSSNSILPSGPVKSPTTSVQNPNTTSTGVTASGNSSTTPAPVTGKKTAWSSLQFPARAAIKTHNSQSMISNSTSLITPNEAWDAPHRILISIIIIALAAVLFWCWRLFTSS